MNKAVRALRMATAVVSASALTACGVGAPDDEATFYGGENVDLVVPYDPGGGYDVYARALAPFLGRCLDAQIVVRNQPGAGGLVATNQTAVSDSDAPRLQILNMQGFAAAQIAGADGVQYDLREFSYAGRIASAPPSLAVATDSAIRSFQDIVRADRPVRFVATGPGSEAYITAEALSAAYDFPVDVITGFESSDQARVAVLDGSADVEALVYDSQLAAIEAGDVRPLVLVADEPAELMPEGTPLISAFGAPNAQSEVTVDTLVTLGELGRTIAAPPGLSNDQLTELRQGFKCALENPRLLRQLESQERPIEYASGAAVTQQVQTAMATPSQFKAAVQGAF